MVKKREKVEAAPAGWGSPQPPAGEYSPMELQPAGDTNGNISDNPENRQPPLDEGWDANTPPSPMAMPAAADPAPPAEPEKPKKRVKAGSSAADPIPATPKAKGGNSDSALINYVERLERLAEERQTITDDMKEVVSEAKANGYDAGILKKVIARRKRGRDAVMEEEALIETYQEAVGWDD